MNSISRILIPFDFSPVAMNTLSYAFTFCKDNGHSDILLSYVASNDNYDSKKEQMKTFLESLSSPGNVTVSGNVSTGDFVKELLAEQLDFKADMMFMGTKGADDSSGKALSNTSKITLGAHCPVLVIPVDYKEFKIENITLAIGNNKIEDAKVLSTLLVIARRYNARIHVLTVFDEDDDAFYSDSQNEATLKYYFEKYYSFSSSTRSKNIAESIFDYDQAHGIDMLAIIPRNHTEESTPTQGRLTQFLTLKTEIPLLTMNK